MFPVDESVVKRLYALVYTVFFSPKEPAFGIQCDGAFSFADG